MIKTKTKLSIVIALLIGVAFTYTACKKSSSQPKGPALTPKQVSSQVALNISQTLFGGYGGFNLNDGLNTPNTLGVVHNRLRVSSTDNPLCGLVADTTLNYSETSGGVSASVKGQIKFSFTCTNDVLSGYNFFTNLAVAESTSDFSIALKIAENITVISSNPNDDNATLSFNGTVASDGTYDYKTGANKGTGTSAFNYTYKSIIIDPNDPYGVKSGTATFSTKGAGTNGAWDYSGTITFLGNNKVKITINGADYTVDLTTGQ